MRLNRSIIGWPQGGLGNQLFQLNAALAASRIASARLLLATSGFSHLRDRELELAPLSEDIPRLSRIEHAVVRPYSKFGRQKSRIFGTGLRVATSIDQATTPGAVLVGFFQDSESVAYGTTATLERLAAVQLSTEVLPLAKRVSESVAVHVRRGDYVSLPSSVTTFGEITPDYYFRGLEALETRPRDAIYFTDDPEWVSSKFGVRASNIISSADIPSSLQTVLTMAHARELLMPNSTFSWWAGELVARRGGRIAGPTTWFFDREDSKSLVRPGWIHLENA